jgi:arylsulfatase A-like enzyme
MNRRLIRLPAGGLGWLMVLLVCMGVAAAAAEVRPNFIIILTEDLGYHDVGFNGGKDIPTPHLDSIASNGICFTSGYAAGALSAASRAGLMTGRYPERFGNYDESYWRPNNANDGLPLSQVTLADMLSQAGYQCGAIGKWGLGVHPNFNPLKRGFQEFYGFLGTGAAYFPEELTNDVPGKLKADYEAYHLRILRNNVSVVTTNYLTDEFSDEAVRFIARNKAKPFFLYLAYNAPHPPLEAPDNYLSRFPDLQSPHRKTYAAMISAVDDGVGRLLVELRKAGLENQTLVVFLSATGGSLDQNSSDNYPLRGARYSPWEGAWRVPWLMKWPGRLPAGLVYDQPVIALDLFPTIAALAAIPLPNPQSVDGVNLTPYLTGVKTGSPHDAIYWSIPQRGAFAVRSGNYKLVIPESGQPAELFNLKKDIAESRNIASSEPEKVAELEQKRMAWTRSLADPEASGANLKERPPTNDGK